MRNLVKQSWLSVASGLMYGLAWEPYGMWPLAMAGWAGWMWGLSRLLPPTHTHHDAAHDPGGMRSRIFWHSLVFVLSAWLLSFHWVMLHPISVAAMTSGVALLAYASLFAALTVWGISMVPGRLPPVLLAAILSTLLFEMALQYGPFAMPWLSLGLSTAPSSWALSVGAWMGSQGTALVVLLMASAFVVALRLWPTHRLVSVLVASGLLLFLGLPMLHSTASGVGMEGDVRIRILEPGMSPDEWSNVHDVSRVDSFAAILQSVQQQGLHTDVTILPETALPMGPADSLHAWASRLSRVAGSPVLTGGIETGRPDAPGRAFNVVVSSENPEATYAKRRLVPFAEHVPFSEWIPGFSRFSVPAGGVSSYAKGSGEGRIRLGTLELAPLICFESLFDRDARTALNAYASMLVVTTQDGWWGSDIPRRQHLAFSQMLAASTGHPVIHATVDGTSGLIDAGGHLSPLYQDHAQVLSGVLSMDTRPTWFMAMGNRPFFGIFGALAALLVVVIWRARALERSSQVPS